VAADSKWFPPLFQFIKKTVPATVQATCGSASGKIDAETDIL